MPEAERPETPDASFPRLVAITGATGFVGRSVVRELLSRGFNVRALARDAEPARQMLPREDRLQIVEGDLFDSDARASLVEGANAVVHLIGIRREPGRGITFERMHVDGTARILDAAKAAGVTRFIQMSALGTRSGAPSRYHQTKLEGELLVQQSGLDWTILRPSIIHGPDGEFMQMARGWVTGEAQPKFFLPYFEQPGKPIDERRLGESPRASFVQPVAVEDVAWVVGACLQRDMTIGEIYPIGGPDAFSWPDLLTTIRDLVPGAKASLKPFGVPAPVALCVAQAAGTIGAGRLLPFGPDDVHMATEDSVCSNVKASKHLGFNPVSFVDRVREYAGQIG